MCGVDRLESEYLVRYPRLLSVVGPDPLMMCLQLLQVVYRPPLTEDFLVQLTDFAPLEVFNPDQIAIIVAHKAKQEAMMMEKEPMMEAKDSMAPMAETTVM